MIAKLVTTAATRDEAIAMQRMALDEYYIRGIAHNIGFLSSVMAHPRWKSGDISTNFIAEEYPDGFLGGVLTNSVKEAMACAALYMNAVEISRALQFEEGKISDVYPPQDTKWHVTINDEEIVATILPTEEGVAVFINGKTLEVATPWVPGGLVFKASIDEREIAIEIDATDMGYQLTSDGVSADVRVQTSRGAELYKLMPEKVEADTSKFLLCPMPGLIVSVAVAEGDEVKAGQTLAVVEAMKMENILRAEKDVTIAAVNAVPGDSMAVDAIIMEFSA